MLQNMLAWPRGYAIGIGLWIGLGVLALPLLLRWRRRWREQPRLRRFAQLGLGLWLVLCALTIPELATALLLDQTDSFSQTNVSRRWFQTHVQINIDGYRDARPLPRERLDGQRNIAFIGDSFTFGHGIKNPSERFTDRLQQRLKRVDGIQINIHNVGLPGIDIRQLADVQAMEIFDLEIPIDWLVYVFVPNDIEYCDPGTVNHLSQMKAIEPGNGLIGGTYFYNMLWYRWHALRSPTSGGYYEYLKGSYAGSPWDRFEVKLDQVREHCEAHGIHFAVVAFPFLHQGESQYDFDLAHEKLAASCRLNQVPYLDLRATLFPHAREGLVVNRQDSHPNERAHELASEAIQPWIEAILRNPPPATTQ